MPTDCLTFGGLTILLLSSFAGLSGLFGGEALLLSEDFELEVD